MTREEIIKEYEGAVVANGLAAAAGNEEAVKSYELFKAGLDALRPITREQVEKMRGEVVETVEKGRMKRVFSCCGCDFTSLTCWITPKFCPSCGAPITDKAVDMVMERMETIR